MILLGAVGIGIKPIGYIDPSDIVGVVRGPTFLRKLGYE